MDSIEERYSTLKSITCISLVLGLMIAFASILSRESINIELMMKEHIKSLKRKK